MESATNSGKEIESCFSALYSIISRPLPVYATTDSSSRNWCASNYTTLCNRPFENVVVATGDLLGIPPLGKHPNTSPISRWRWQFGVWSPNIRKLAGHVERNLYQKREETVDLRAIPVFIWQLTCSPATPSLNRNAIASYILVGAEKVRSDVVRRLDRDLSFSQLSVTFQCSNPVASCEISMKRW